VSYIVTYLTHQSLIDKKLMSLQFLYLSISFQLCLSSLNSKYNHYSFLSLNFTKLSQLLYFKLCCSSLICWQRCTLRWQTLLISLWSCDIFKTKNSLFNYVLITLLMTQILLSYFYSTSFTITTLKTVTYIKNLFIWNTLIKLWLLNMIILTIH